MLEIIQTACREEITALKPGNVSVYSSGHGMTAEDFFLSADLVAPILAQPGLTVGERVLGSIEATNASLGCNTNLGIVLLAAPLSAAVLTPFETLDLRTRLREVLKSLDRRDAQLVFAAIRLAKPAGLGSSPRHDIHTEPRIGLLEAMSEAQARDRVAYQYAHAYADVFDLGLSRLNDPPMPWVVADQRLEWATVACYLGFLGAFPDSHIQRKFGAGAARRVRSDAQIVETKLKACENRPDAVQLLLHYDKQLKREGLNPGTSADLTVASLMALQFADLLIGNRCITTNE